MTEFNYQLISILFGVSGTFILLFSSIFSYKKKIQNREEFNLISQMIGYLFLFDSFLYLLWPKINHFFLTLIYGLNLPITNYNNWPYYLFVLVGIGISLFLIKEKNYGRGLEVNFLVENIKQTIIFYSPLPIAVLALIINKDLLPAINLILWVKLMKLIWKKH